MIDSCDCGGGGRLDDAFLTESAGDLAQRLGPLARPVRKARNDMSSDIKNCLQRPAQMVFGDGKLFIASYKFSLCASCRDVLQRAERFAHHGKLAFDLHFGKWYFVHTTRRGTRQNSPLRTLSVKTDNRHRVLKPSL